MNLGSNFEMVLQFLLLLVAFAIGLATSSISGTYFKPFNVSYDHRALIIDGQRRMLTSAGIHYPRASPEVSIHILLYLVVTLFLVVVACFSMLSFHDGVCSTSIPNCISKLSSARLLPVGYLMGGVPIVRWFIWIILLLARLWNF